MKCVVCPLLLLLICSSVLAQDKNDSANRRKDSTNAADSTIDQSVFILLFGKYPKHRDGIYMTRGGDGPLLSFASMMLNGEALRNIPRFSWFFNMGTNFNKDYTKNVGVFAGINIKNIGLISKPADSLKLKQRVYTVGIPLGFKIGDVSGGTFFLYAGGEIDLAFNYKEKQFIDGKKSTFNEWLSDRTPLLMPSLFAGFRMGNSLGLKVQYYLNNFFNTDFKTKENGRTVYPYKNLKANLVFVTLSYNFNNVDHKEKSDVSE